jgi:putative redox protein
MKIEIEWLRRSAFAGRSESNHWVMMDSTHNGGDGAAPTPMELLLLSLGGCSAVDVWSTLERMREPLGSLRVEAEGERAEKHPRVFTRIHLTYRIGGGVNKKKAERAVKLSMERYCSVSAMLEKTAEITSEIILED